MALRLHTHSRIEVLARHLASTLQKAPLTDPFTPEWVLIPHAGIKAWLDPFLAKELGIWSRGWLLYPRAALWRLAHQVTPEILSQPRLQPQEIAWFILQTLPTWLQDPVFQPVQAYFEAGGTAALQWQWARKVAELLDLYGIYRPDWLLAWASGKVLSQDPTELWQARIWQDLISSAPQNADLAEHNSALKLDRRALKTLFMQTLKNISGPQRSRLPVRLSIFAVGSLPPFYLEMIQALAEHIEVNTWLPLPTIRPDRLSQSAIDLPPLTLNSQSLERFFVNLLQIGAEHLPLAEATPETQSMQTPDMQTRPKQTSHKQTHLQILKSALWFATAPGDKTPPEDATPDPCDASLQIHDCHSPLREVEVLHDEILRAFVEIPDLQPGEIGIVVPDLDTYAPLIQAVFGTFQSGAQRQAYLPFQIIDANRGDNVTVRAFQSLLELCHQRLTLPEIMALLEQEVIYRAFYFQSEDLKLCTTWLNAVQVRWGLDSAQRKKFDLPALAANTWRKGLQRLLLGYAGDFKQPLAGLLAYPHIEGSSARTLGHLLDFFDSLEKSLKLLESSHPLEAWPEILLSISGRMLKPRHGELEALFQLQEDFGYLIDPVLQSEGLYPEKATLSMILPQLESRWSGPADRMVMSGLIAFGTPAVLRSLPFRMLGLLGLNAGIWPRQEPENELNLMLRAPRTGDFSQSGEDRAFFLDCLTAVQDRLYLSYLGRRVKDNKPVPPSVLISELLELLPLNVIQHPLQPYDPSYFLAQETQGLPQRSFNTVALRAAQAHQCAQKRPPLERSFIDTKLDVAAIALLEWQELQRFFRHPARYFLRQQLGLVLREQSEELPESENFSLNALEAFFIKERYLGWRIQGGKEADFIHNLELSDQLPAGPGGQIALEQLLSAIRPLAQALEHWAIEPREQTFQLNILETEIYGRIGLFRPGWIQVRPAQLKAGDYLLAWLQFLLLNCLTDQEQLQHTPLYWIGLEKKTARPLSLQFKPFAQPLEAQSHLENYLRLYQTGLSAPLLFAPETSLVRLQEEMEESPQAVAKARSQWEGGLHMQGESLDPDYLLCLPEEWYASAEALKLAQSIYGPLLSHLSICPLSEILESNEHARL